MSDEQPGAIPVWAPNGRPSKSLDGARVREIHRLQRMTTLERVVEALELGLDGAILRAPPQKRGK